MKNNRFYKCISVFNEKDKKMKNLNFLNNNQIEKKHSRLHIITDDIIQINFNDLKIKKLFETFRTYSSFEDSWFAVIQGIRHNPRLYKNKIFFCDHPYKNDSLVVYNHLCENFLEFSELLKSLLNLTYKNYVVWKNANPEELAELKLYGFRPYKEIDFWNPIARFDDQTYPQHICLIENINKLKTESLCQLRQQSRAVERKYEDIDIFSYQRSYKSQCLKLLQNTSLHINALQPQELNIILNANIIYLNNPPTYSYVLKQKEELIAFIAFDIRNKVANFNCLIHDRNIKYLATYAMIKISEILSKEGAIWINLSGSESKTLNHWKKKFSPEKSISRTHVIFSLN